MKCEENSFDLNFNLRYLTRVVSLTLLTIGWSIEELKSVLKGDSREIVFLLKIRLRLNGKKRLKNKKERDKCKDMNERNKQEE